MKAVIFDLDGTLIDSAPDIHAASKKMLQSIGVATLPFETVKSFIGNGVPKLVERVMAACKLTGSHDHAELVKNFMGHYNASPSAKTEIYPNLVPTLKALRDEGIALGVCTNKPAEPARAILTDLDLDQYFDVVIGGDTLPVNKPDPAPLMLAFKALDATEMLYVGDSEIDAETAVRAGVLFALFTEGYRKKEIADLPHTYLFKDFADLPAIVDAAFAVPA